MIKFVLRAATILENKDSEQRALREFSATRNLSFIKRNGVLRQVIWLNHLTTDPSSLQPLRQVASRVRFVHYEANAQGDLLESFLIRSCKHITRRS